MEFEIKADGTLRYANNSNYKNDVIIRKEGAFIARCRHAFLRGFELLRKTRCLPLAAVRCGPQ